MQSEQIEKLDRLVRLGIITEREKEDFPKPRFALKKTAPLNIPEGWLDTGNRYTLYFKDRKPITVTPKQVWEAVADKILEVKDPIRETVKEEVPEEKEVEQPPQKREEDEVDYNELTSAELSKVLKKLGLHVSGSKTQKLMRLQEYHDDTEGI